MSAKLFVPKSFKCRLHSLYSLEMQLNYFYINVQSASPQFNLSLNKLILLYTKQKNVH